MTSLSDPGRLVHRGHIAAAGMVLQDGDTAEVRRLVMSLYEPGLRVYRMAKGLVVLFRSERRLPVVGAPGPLLVRQDDLLCAFPVPEEKGSRLGPLTLASAWFGQIEEKTFAKKDEVDLSEWLDLSGLEVFVGQALRPPPPVLIEAVQSSAQNSREALDGAVDAPAQESLALQQALERSISGKNTPPRSQSEGWLARLGQGALRAGLQGGVGLARALAQVFSSGSAPRQLPSGESGEEITARAQSRDPGMWSKMANKLKGMLWQSKMGSWLGRAHAKYLDELFDLFEEGNFDEALRRAIPANKNPGQGGEGADVPLMPFGRRDDLTMGTRSDGGGVLGLQENLFGSLRDAYRRAFEALKRRERHLEAAFVLSELLQEDEEAVEYLESVGLIENAAKLAETRDLDSGLIVRLWFRAGKRERAIAIALRDHAFESALVRLKKFPDDERALRLYWANHLAECGRFAAAVEVARHLEDARELCREWIRRAVLQGGTSGAQALVRRAEMYPEDFAEIREWAQDIVSSESPFDAGAVNALAEGLIALQHPHNTAHALARTTTRALIRDRARGLNQSSHATIRTLARLSLDGALSTDLPDLPVVADLPRLKNRATPLVVKLREDDVGRSEIRDAVILARGKFLLARGDAGVTLHNANGKELTRFDVPADALVVSDALDRVLALKRRGELTSVSQIDVVGRRAARWTELQISTCAMTFDGLFWYVAQGPFVHSLDVQGDGTSFLWRSGDTGSDVDSVHRGPSWLNIGTLNGEVWEHSLDPQRLRRREQLEGVPVLGAPYADVYCSRVDSDDEDPAPFVALSSRGVTDLVFRELSRQGEVPILDADEDWVVAQVQTSVRVISRVDLKTRLVVDGLGSGGVSARLTEGMLAIADERGTMLGFDLGTGSRVIDCRL